MGFEKLNPEIDYRKCLELAKVCKLTYASVIRQSHYSYDGLRFRSQKIVHGSLGRGYCRIFWNEKSVVVAFRGTRENVDWWLSNLKAFPVGLRDSDATGWVPVHRGFQRTLDYPDKSTGRKSLDAIFEHLQDLSFSDKDISITGHSMGGALALLFAVKLRARCPELCKTNLKEIVTFGAPSVGLRAFRDYYGDMAQKTIRFINETDVVPFAPPVFYRHVGHEVWFDGQGRLQDVGWPRRLSKSIASRFKQSFNHHSMAEYIRKLERELEQRL